MHENSVGSNYSVGNHDTGKRLIPKQAKQFVERRLKTANRRMLDITKRKKEKKTVEDSSMGSECSSLDMLPSDCGKSSMGKSDNCESIYSGTGRIEDVLYDNSSLQQFEWDEPSSGKDDVRERDSGGKNSTHLDASFEGIPVGVTSSTLDNESNDKTESQQQQDICDHDTQPSRCASETRVSDPTVTPASSITGPEQGIPHRLWEDVRRTFSRYSIFPVSPTPPLWRGVEVRSFHIIKHQEINCLPICGCGTGGSFVSYRVVVETGRSALLERHRRYNQFLALRQEIATVAPSVLEAPGLSLAEFPPKSFRRHMDDERFLEGRARGLHAFLQALTTHPQAFELMPLRRFLQVGDFADCSYR